MKSAVAITVLKVKAETANSTVAECDVTDTISDLEMLPGKGKEDASRRSTLNF